MANAVPQIPQTRRIGLLSPDRQVQPIECRRGCAVRALFTVVTRTISDKIAASSEDR